MTVEATVGFSIAMLVLALSPGPGVVASVSQALAGGFRSSLSVIGGIITGDLIFLSVAASGMTAIAQAMGEMFFFIRVAGGAVLIWMGVRMWVRTPKSFDSNSSRPKGLWQRYLSGLFITLGNPKVIVFYAGFLPAFMDMKSLSMEEFGIVGLLVAVILAGVLSCYAFLAAHARRFFSALGAARIVHRGAGAMMIGTGIVVASK